MRVAMGVEYDGAAYHGFQLQAEQAIPTIEQALQSALSQLANHAIKVVVAGRTDAGVHATGQVIHFDTTAVRDIRAWVLGANAYLPPDIVVKWAQFVPKTFHARFSAVRRRYVYVIDNGWVRPAIFNRKVTWHCRPLQLGRMQAAAQYFLGKHDFSSFRASECQAKSAVRTVFDLTINRKNDFVVVGVEADAFLHHMVRNIVGVLLPIGEGLQAPNWAQAVLATRDRTSGGVTAPANGLYLHRVTYPEQFSLPTNTGHFFEPL